MRVLPPDILYSQARRRPGSGLWVLLSLLGAAGWAADDPAPKTIDKLKTAIEKALRESNVPGAGLAMVTRDRVLFADGIGMADPAEHRPATADTLFRIGSVTKGFTSLAILKLQEQGKLSLNDPLRKYAPDVWYRNPWEATDPVRIVHLLEHTTGWDDMHLAEYASNDPKPLTVAEGLAFHSDSRISRWRPGTRMAYCNAGPAVAGYVVEKITGRRFEDFVQENLFRPLHMDSASYLLTPEVQRNLSGLFGNNARERVAYWHISFRPSGAINASPRDMANYVRFYLNRGSVEGVPVLSAQSIDRRERPETTLAARSGLRAGYGLSNYTDVDARGFVWQGHNGAIAGGRAVMAYLPAEGVGYAFMINASNGAAEDRIHRLLQAFLTREIKPPAIPPPASGGAGSVQPYTGWYEPASPRSQFAHFVNRIGALERVTVDKGELVVAELGTSVTNYVYAGSNLWRDRDSPLPEALLMPHAPEGVYLQTDQETLRRIPPWEAWLELGVAGVWLSLTVMSLGFALYWAPAELFRRLAGLPGERHLSVRALPLLAVLAAMALPVVMGRVGNDQDMFQRLGAVTGWSVSILVLTTLFPLLTLASLIQLWRARRWKIQWQVYWFSVALSLTSAAVVLYLGYWGKIAFRTWS